MVHMISPSNVDANGIPSTGVWPLIEALQLLHVGPQVYLLDYEQAHPEDVTGGVCAICGGGEDVGDDWISCDLCDTWVHFSCDPRAQQAQLGPYREYASGSGRSFTCIQCNEVKKKSRKEK